MKFSIKSTIFTTSILLFAGISTSLFGSIADTITDWLTSGEDTYQVCQNIGKKGRLLAALPRKTKDAVLKKCEFELLGIERNYSSEDLSYDDGKRNGTIHPHAWKALIKTPIADLDTAAQQRRTELQQLRKQKKTAPSQPSRKKEARSKTQEEPAIKILPPAQEINKILDKYTSLGKITNLQPLTENSTCDEVKKMYRKLALRVHPDKGGEEQDFSALIKAYESFNEIMCQ